jgi:SAM-dependent methyltransferase
MSTKNDEIREQVKDAYSKAVTSKSKESSCCSAPVSKGAAAKLAGYTKEEISTLPIEAVENSFGCGNPLAFSSVKEGEVVVDLGSGAGIDMLLAAKKVGEKGRVIGIDMTPQMIEKAKENIKAAGLNNIEVRLGTIENLPVEDNSVDWVISNCVINLSPEKDKVFSEIFRVLRKNGKMLISDMVVESLPEWAKNVPQIYNSCIGGAVSEEEYIAYIKNAGLNNIEIKSRFVYDDSTLKGLVKSEISESSCCSQGIDILIEKAIPDLSGKIASIKVYAEKVYF